MPNLFFVKRLHLDSGVPSYSAVQSCVSGEIRIDSENLWHLDSRSLPHRDVFESHNHPACTEMLEFADRYVSIKAALQDEDMSSGMVQLEEFTGGLYTSQKVLDAALEPDLGEYGTDHFWPDFAVVGVLEIDGRCLPITCLNLHDLKKFMNDTDKDVPNCDDLKF
jgi:hypothetical protein